MYSQRIGDMERKKIALFDFDGTLTTKDTFIEFGVFAVGKKRFMTALVRNSFVLAAWKLGIIPNHKAKQKLFSTLYKGMTADDFNRKCEEFAPKIDSILNPEGYRELRRHLDEGTPIYIVSASMENWIKPWAQKEGDIKLIATIPETDESNKLTGRFLTKNCYGKEKLSRIREMCSDIDSYDVWAYGDSKGDEEILRFSKHPHIIKNQRL